jgi:hypothetical protein
MEVKTFHLKKTQRQRPLHQQDPETKTFALRRPRDEDLRPKKTWR